MRLLSFSLEKKLNVKQLISIKVAFQFPVKEECPVFWSLTKYLLLTSFVSRFHMASVAIFQK